MSNAQDQAVVFYPFISVCDHCHTGEPAFVRLDECLGTLCKKCDDAFEAEWEADRQEFLRDRWYDWIDEQSDKAWNKMLGHIDWQNSVGALYDVQDDLSGFGADRNAVRSTRELKHLYLPGEWCAIEAECPF